jgi:hypothetical protein
MSGNLVRARRPVADTGRVSRYIAGAIRRFGAGMQTRLAEINGQPGVLGLADGVLVGVLVFELSGGTIAAMRIVTNPDKLGFAARQAGLSHSPGLAGP